MGNETTPADHSLATPSARWPKLPEHLQVIRDALSDHEYGRLAQEAICRSGPDIYAQGVRDGEAKARQAMQDQRERRTVARGRKQWVTSVYFLRSPTAIKIGVSKNPRRRMQVLQTGHPEPLELAATCEGGRELERQYHHRFAAHRVSKEWFSAHPAILAEIERLQEA